MGLLTPPSHRAINLDTSTNIYIVEHNEPYFILFASAWQQAQVPNGSGGVKTRMPDDQAHDSMR